MSRLVKVDATSLTAVIETRPRIACIFCCSVSEFVGLRFGIDDLEGTLRFADIHLSVVVVSKGVVLVEEAEVTGVCVDVVAVVACA